MNVIDSQMFQIARDGVVPDNFDAATAQDNLNERDANGVTPFHVACWNGNIDVVRLLIPHVDIKAKDNFQRSPFLATILGPEALSYPLAAYLNNDNYLTEKRIYLKPNLAMGEDFCEILSLLANHYRMEWNEGLDDCKII